MAEDHVAELRRLIEELDDEHSSYEHRRFCEMDVHVVALAAELTAARALAARWQKLAERRKRRLELRDLHDADCASYLRNDEGERLYLCNCGHDAALSDELPKEKSHGAK